MKNNLVDSVIADVYVCLRECVSLRRRHDAGNTCEKTEKTAGWPQNLRRLNVRGWSTNSQSRSSPRCSWAWCSLPGWRWRSAPPRFPSSRAYSSKPSPACLLRQTEGVKINTADWDVSWCSPAALLLPRGSPSISASRRRPMVW